MKKSTEYELSREQLAYTVPEAARVARVGTSTLYVLMQRGELPFIKIGTRRLIAPADLQSFLAKHRISAEVAA